MSCAAVTVNRSLILLAIVWGLIPVAAFQAVTMSGTTDDAVALHGMLDHEHPRKSRAAPRTEPLPCQLDESRGLIPALSLAISQPNRKHAGVTNGR